jgi:PAS domain S-box-containing protein
MLLVTMVAVIPIGILNISSGAVSFAAVLFGVAGFSVLGIYLNAKGYHRVAATFLPLLIFFASVYTIIDGDGLSDPGIVALPLFILIVSLFFEKRAIIAASLFAIASPVVLFGLDSYGVLELAQPPRIGRVVTLVILMATTGIIAWMIVDLREKNLAVIRSREIRFRTLFIHSTDAITIMEGDTFIDCNPGALTLFGVERDQIIGSAPYTFSPAIQPSGRNSKDLALDKIRRANEEGPQRFEWQHQRLDGTLIDVEVILNRVDLEGKKVLLAVLRDLTERKLAEFAAQEERQRLARELHDAVSQTLWSASLIADVLPDLWEQDIHKGRDRLQRLRQLTDGALAEMRALLLELRPAALVKTPLDELMQGLCEAIANRTGWEVVCEADKDCALHPDVHLGFYRIAQEALNNVVHHAAADKIEVRLRCNSDNVTLIVRDDGRGFDPSSPATGQHLGIVIMRERAAAMGAILVVESKPNSGTKIQVDWAKQSGRSDA